MSEAASRPRPHTLRFSSSSAVRPLLGVGAQPASRERVIIHEGIRCDAQVGGQDGVKASRGVGLAPLLTERVRDRLRARAEREGIGECDLDEPLRGRHGDGAHSGGSSVGGASTCQETLPSPRGRAVRGPPGPAGTPTLPLGGAGGAGGASPTSVRLGVEIDGGELGIAPASHCFAAEQPTAAASR